MGKPHHHCVVINAEGTRLLSRRVGNDEPELLALIGDVAALVGEVTWAVDLHRRRSRLADRPAGGPRPAAVVYPWPHRHRTAVGYRGEGKTDARDAAIIADQARMRRDLHPLRPGDEITVELKILTTRRADVIADRTRVTNRLRGLLSGIYPALERALDDLTGTGQLPLRTGYQTPAALRRIGATRLESWLRNRKVRSPNKIATAAVQAAERQHTTLLPGETLTVSMIATLAGEVMALNEQIRATDKPIEGQFYQHELAGVITSLPGVGALLGAEFLAATGGDMGFFGTPDRLAGFAGLAPAPWDSGRIPGNLHRPKRYHRGLNRVFYYSAMISITRCPASRQFYDRKCAESKRHTQAVLALARRRVNVLWALMRDNRLYQPSPPIAAAA